MKGSAGIGKNEMLEKIKRITAAHWLFLSGLVVAVFILYSVVLAITRLGEVKVSIETLPRNAGVSIDGKLLRRDVVYLRPGEYTFSASAEGWANTTQTLEVKKGTKVILLPEPRSEEVKNWLKDHPDIQLKREELGGKSFAIKSEQAVQKNPLIGLLPYSQSSPPFRIDFGLSKERKGDIFLLITDSSPNGRQAALKWIRQQGYDPTDLEIVFPDFPNPLEDKGRVERY